MSNLAASALDQTSKQRGLLQDLRSHGLTTYCIFGQAMGATAVAGKLTLELDDMVTVLAAMLLNAARIVSGNLRIRGVSNVGGEPSDWF